MEQQEAQIKLKELLKNAHTGTLATTEMNDTIVSRPMALQQVEFDGDLWFFTNRSSDKVHKLEHHEQVNVVFESNNTWVSVSGYAEMVEDRAKAEELWNPLVKAYHRDGLKDPELILIKVQANSSEYWDSDNKLVSLVKIAKALATDVTPDLSDYSTMTF